VTDDPPPATPWTGTAAERYDRASTVLRALVAACSALSTGAEPGAAAAARDRQAGYAAELRGLTPTDTAAVDRVLSQHPAALQSLRTAADR
jgi:hypothetical protein